MDASSLVFFLDNISKVTDDLMRSLIWFNIAQHVKFGLLRVDDFINFVVKSLLDEPLAFVQNKLLTNLYSYLVNFVPREDMVTLTTIVHDAIYLKLQDPNVPSLDQVQVLIKHYIKYTQTQEQIFNLRLFFMGNDPKLADRQIISQDAPWDIVKKVFSFVNDL